MILPGHIAISIICHKLFRIDLPTAVAATLVPDAVDKGLAQVLHLAPSGRYAMHCLPGWLVSSLLVGCLGGKRRGYAWAIGHLAHFLGDQGDIPWWLPFRRYNFDEIVPLDDFLLSVFSTSQGRKNLLLETTFLLLTLLWLWGGRRKE